MLNNQFLLVFRDAHLIILDASIPDEFIETNRSSVNGISIVVRCQVVHNSVQLEWRVADSIAHTTESGTEVLSVRCVGVTLTHKCNPLIMIEEKLLFVYHQYCRIPGEHLRYDHSDREQRSWSLWLHM